MKEVKQMKKKKNYDFYDLVHIFARWLFITFIGLNLLNAIYLTIIISINPDINVSNILNLNTSPEVSIILTIIVTSVVTYLTITGKIKDWDSSEEEY